MALADTTMASPAAIADDPPCYIITMPLEIILRITDNLPTPDLCSFRITCRSIEESLYNAFTSEFFTRKQFMISNFSLQALIDMAKSRIGQHMRVVQIGTDNMNSGGFEIRPSTDEHAQRFRELLEQDTALWTTGSWRDLLTEAFQSLSNLEDVVIRDCNSNGRVRDGERAMWKSYGATTHLQETGERLSQTSSKDWHRAGFPYAIPDEVFGGVLYAAVQSGAQLKGVEVISRYGWRLSLNAFNPTFTTLDHLEPALQRLEKLHVTLAYDNSDLNQPSSSAGDLSASSGFLEFLSRAKSLKNLRINENWSSQNLGGFLRRIVNHETTAPTDGEAPLPVLMPQIEELSLGMMFVNERDLLAFIGRFASSLTSLELWKVRLHRPLPEDPLDLPEYPKMLEMPFWPSFFKKLQAMPDLNLRHIKVGMLQQKWAPHVSCRVSFNEDGPTIAYTGPDWRTFVEKSVIPQIEVIPPPQPPPIYTEDPSSGSSDSQGESSEDDENE